MDRDDAPTNRNAVRTDRATRRQQARAGRWCRFCGEEFEAARSTRWYCSARCRFAYHRSGRQPKKREGLRPAQVRVLEVLAGAVRGWMRQDDLLRRARVAPGHASDLLGQLNRTRRSARAARTGVRSLLALGYVRRHKLDVDGVWERWWEVTAAGRAALQAST
jgi:hypothetical protein